METGELESIRAIIERVVSSFGMELVDVELKSSGHGRTVVIYMDKEGGVTVEDCAAVSKQVDMVLEAQSAMKNLYTLEVSSPGLTRPLKKPADYKWAMGKLAVLKLKKPLGRSKRVLVTIEDAFESSVSVIVKETGETKIIDYENISKANLEIEF